MHHAPTWRTGSPVWHKWAVHHLTRVGRHSRSRRLAFAPSVQHSAASAASDATGPSRMGAAIFIKMYPNRRPYNFGKLDLGNLEAILKVKCQLIVSTQLTQSFSRARP